MTEEEIFKKLGGFNPKPINNFVTPKEDVALNPFTGKPIVSIAGQLGTSMVRGIPQLATGLIDLAALPLSLSDVVKPENVFGSTE